MRLATVMPTVLLVPVSPVVVPRHRGRRAQA